ncbi:MAG: DUF3800 domain-containing protein [bacterium]|nr:DUF3800 domain-containing protein [bacterium]
MYKIYIDESGDLGNNFLEDPTKRSTYWFILSAIIIEDKDLLRVEQIIDNAKEKLKTAKDFHFKKDKHVKRNVFINKIAEIQEFNSIIVAQDKMKLVSICKMEPERPFLTSQKIFEHVARILFKEMHYMFSKETDNLEFEAIFEKNAAVDYQKIQEIATTFSNEKIKINVTTCGKECKCIQIADYLASSILEALEENKIDEQVDTSYIDKLIGKLYHYDTREFPNIARMAMHRSIEGPYKHRIKLLSSHAMGKFQMKKQGWTRFIQECF